MKQRILTLLKLAAFGDGNTLHELVIVSRWNTRISNRKSTRLIDEILDNFSDFQVKTVDSFMSTVFKSSSLDRRNDPDYEILLGADRIFDLSV